MATYSEKLKDPRWQKKRLEILNRDKWACQKCFNDKETLHVHHRQYQSGKEPWECDVDFLVTLCASCHEDETECLNVNTQYLVSQVRQKFFSDDIWDIYEGFGYLKIQHTSRITSAAIKEAFMDEKFMEKLVSDYARRRVNRRVRDEKKRQKSLQKKDTNGAKG